MRHGGQRFLSEAFFKNFGAPGPDMVDQLTGNPVYLSDIFGESRIVRTQALQVVVEMGQVDQAESRLMGIEHLPGTVCNPLG